MTKWIVIGVVFLATSCSFIVNKNEDLIERDVFTDVLVDIHIADALLAEKGLRVNSDSVRISKYYDDVFKKHGVSRKMFEQTVVYYTEHSLDYKFIYDNVVEKLNYLEEESNETGSEK